MQPNTTSKTKSGRPRVPTKRYQSYVEESTKSTRTNKKAKTVNDAVIHMGETQSVGNNSNNPSINTESHLAKPLASKDCANNIRSYPCRHCAVSAVCSSPQEFMKLHHMLDENRECYDKGLIHCPNKDCKKRCFSQKKIS
jgi:hypothetical protein